MQSNYYAELRARRAAKNERMWRTVTIASLLIAAVCGSLVAGVHLTLLIIGPAIGW